MIKSKEEGYFTWISDDGFYPFPLDYGMKELKRLWGVDISHIRECITDFESFQNMYHWMRYVKTEKDVIEKSEYKGIPVELEPFMRIYLDEALKYGKKEMQKGKNAFIKKLCNLLHDETMKKELMTLSEKINRGTYASETESAQSIEKQNDIAKPDDLYWYRRLYENHEFQKEISLAYWEEEYSFRCEAVRELSLQMPQEIQIKQLQKMIAFMDTQIGAMLHILNRPKKEEPETKSGKDFLETFPQELLGKLRKRDEKYEKQGKFAAYKLENYEIKTTIKSKEIKKTLEEYFEDIRGNKDRNAKREAVRPVYLKNMCSIPGKSEFQIACEQLQDYLEAYIDEKKKDEYITAFIVHRCGRYYGSLLDFVVTEPGLIQPGAHWNIGAELVIDELLSSLYTTFYTEKCHVINDICWSLGNSEECCKNYQELILNCLNEDIPKNQICKAGAEWFATAIKALNVSVMFSDVLHDDMIVPKYIELISKSMGLTCELAYAFFGKTKPDWMSADNFEHMWNRYNQIQEINDTIAPARTCKEDIQLCGALLVCMVYMECLKVVDPVFASYKELVNYIKNKKDGPISGPSM